MRRTTAGLRAVPRRYPVRGWLVCVGGDPTRASPSCPLVAQLTCRNKLIEKSDELISKEEIQASFRSDLRVPCP